MAAHDTNARRFIAIMEKAGASVSFARAGTGTIYVTVDGSFKARFADHGECYCREDISVDPDGCTLRQAVEAAGKALNLNVAASLASMDRAAKAAATRASKSSASFEDKMARREAAVARWIAVNSPDFATMKSAARHEVTMAALKATQAEWA